MKYTIKYPKAKRMTCVFAFLLSFTFITPVSAIGVLDNPQDEGKQKEYMPQYAPGEVLVKFKEGANPSSILKEAGIKAQGLERIHSIKPAVSKFKKDYKLEKDENGWYPFLGKKYKEVNEIPDEEMFKEAYKNMAELEKSLYRSYKLKLPKGVSVEGAIGKLENNPNIEYAEPNYIRKIQMIPNDPYYSSSGSWGQPYDDLWGIKKIQCEQAWDISQGEGVVVAVIDTGVDYNHEDIAANVWINPGEDLNRNGLVETADFNRIDDDNNGYIDDIRGWDFAYNDNDPMDGDGHGTHVSGTIAAVGNNHTGVIGVAPRAKIMAVKGLSDGGPGTDADLANCVKYAADNGARVLNNSWGGYGSSQTLTDAFHVANDNGVVCIASAGNDNGDVEDYSPANIDTVIAVSASNQNDEKLGFSNYGAKIDVAAPGGDNESADGDNFIGCNILSLRANNTDMYGDGISIVGDNYYRTRGTSMACPHVAGVAALLLSKDPQLTNDDVRRIMQIYSDDIGNGGKDDYFGYGRVNAYQALIMPPKISLAGITVNDVAGNNNGYIDPGEAVRIIVELKAAGSDFYNVSTELTCDDSLITIQDGSSTFEVVLNDQGVTNVTDPYRIDISPTCPRGQIINLRLLIRATGYQLETTIPIKVWRYWPFDPARYGFWWSASVADINTDGNMEIIFGGFTARPSRIALFCVDKSGQQLWKREFPGFALTSPAISDLNNDGDLEIVCIVTFYFDMGIYCIDKDGKTLWRRFFMDASGGDLSYPVIADIIGDSRPEILCTYWDTVSGASCLVCLDSDGNILWEYYVNGRFHPGFMTYVKDIASPAVANVNGDSNLEVLFSTSEGDLYCVNAYGQDVWHMPIGYWNSTPTIADLDRDGRPEILVGTAIDRERNGLWCIDGDGQVIWRYVTEHGTVESSPAVADLDENGNLEVVVGSYYDGNIYCIDANGQELWRYDTGDTINSSPAIADIDGDGHLEILVGSDDFYIYCIDRRGNLVWRYETKAWVRFSPAVADLDGDLALEVLVGSDALYCLDKNGNDFIPTEPQNPLLDPMPWPMFQHDSQHTGFYKRPYDPPTLTTIGNKTINVGNILTFTVSATDPNNDPITYKVYQAGDLNHDRWVTFPDRQLLLAALGSKQGDAKYNPEADLDNDGWVVNKDWLIFIGLLGKQKPSGITIDSASGLFNWTPQDNQIGKHLLTYMASDGNLSDTETVTITVNKPKVPVITAVQPYWGRAGTRITITGGNFSERDTNSSKVTFSFHNYRKTAHIISWKDNEIICYVPKLTYRYRWYKLWVSTKGGQSNYRWFYYY